MARVIEERWVGIGYDVVKEHLPVGDEHGRPLHDALGLPRTVEHTTLVLFVNEPGVQRVVRIPFTDDARKGLVSKLTGGIVVAANGDGPAI